LLFGLLVIVPVAMLINGVEPAAVAGWMGMIVASMAWTWWSERRRLRRWLRQHGGPPRRPTSPCAEEFAERVRKRAMGASCAAAEESAPEAAQRSFWRWRARWGAPKAENASAAPAELWIVDQPAYGPDPDILSAHRCTVVEAIEDAWREGKAAGRSNAEIETEMVGIIASSCRKPASRGGAGGRQRGGRGGAWSR
jgi:hypothetical protein